MIPTLNLLSPKDQDEMRRAKLLLIIHEVLLLLFMAAVLGAATLLGARLILEQRFREVIIEEVPGTEKVARLNRDIQHINQRIALIERLTSNFAYQFPSLKELAELTPPGISYNLLNLREDGTLTMKGTANKRADLLELKSLLEQSPRFLDITLPLQYLIGQQNIDFGLDARINRNL